MDLIEARRLEVKEYGLEYRGEQYRRLFRGFTMQAEIVGEGGCVRDGFHGIRRFPSLRLHPGGWKQYKGSCHFYQFLLTGPYDKHLCPGCQEAAEI